MNKITLTWYEDGERRVAIVDRQDLYDFLEGLT